MPSKWPMHASFWDLKGSQRFDNGRAAPGIEPRTSRTRSENHATRPSSRQLLSECSLLYSMAGAVHELIASNCGAPDRQRSFPHRRRSCISSFRAFAGVREHPSHPGRHGLSARREMPWESQPLLDAVFDRHVARDVRVARCARDMFRLRMIFYDFIFSAAGAFVHHLPWSCDSMARHTASTQITFATLGYVLGARR